MKVINITMELVIDDDITNLDKIADYLNNKLYTDPEFFGDFGPENIESIDNEDGTPIYDQKYGWANDPSE
jgi:hypothetical protein